jgi:hypothetical protein
MNGAGPACACLAPQRSQEASSRRTFELFYAAAEVVSAFHFLRGDSNPTIPKLPAKSGSVAGSGVDDGTSSSEPSVIVRSPQ